ncbi:HD-GYP domain-containing protein [Paenibacillus sp. GCM10012307]|uniref:HD-GYP domain-containing protein n=1 Tax=Paenibacillus roseus TaxID=2798579 RepID=A0A934J2M8_9BACL|nr:HD-GYP domain-containing protein [Paenibacillus roseus]MBJ6362159.1 HD-GYP domain-containing protein [Paenibacillus roseus]
MRLVPIVLCRPGMRLGKRIISEEGIILLGEHMELTEKLIFRLRQSGINFVYIEDSLTSDIVVPELISDETRIRALDKIRTTFKDMMNAPKLRSGVTYPYIAKQFKQVMTMVMDEIGSHKDAMIMLMNIGVVDSYLFQHSLNVCIYTTLLGMAHGYNQEELMKLGMGALLHDVGKTQVPASILLKPGALTDEEFDEMKRHTDHGFYLLKDEPNIPLIVAHCAYQHHERLDGSGYPRGIRGHEIHEYAKWIGLVDSYDAMTTSRVYRAPMLPHQAIEELYVGTGTLYEQSMVQLFRDKVVIYPVGLTVQLNTGESGVVVDTNSTFPHRPIIRVLYNEAGEILAAPYEIDLSKHLSTMIIQVNFSDTGMTAKI